MLSAGVLRDSDARPPPCLPLTPAQAGMADVSLRLGGHSQWVVMGMGQALGGGTTFSDLSVPGSGWGQRWQREDFRPP